MFEIRPALFADPGVWLEALSQSAWSTGAGWGLLLTISSYSRQKEDVTLNNFISGFGNNTASLICGVAILSSVFALAPTEAEALLLLKKGNQALSFIVLPELFIGLPLGNVLSVLFFGAFMLAAFSSLLTMLEMTIRLFTDFKISRPWAVAFTGIACSLFGLPSALSLDFFSNQDWVWGLGLVLSGMFTVIVALRPGLQKFKQQYIDKDSDYRVHINYLRITFTLVLIAGPVLLWWWMSRGYDTNPWFTASGSWNFFSVYSNNTMGCSIDCGLAAKWLAVQKACFRKEN